MDIKTDILHESHKLGNFQWKYGMKGNSLNVIAAVKWGIMLRVPE
jgi:hypothetical protein